jgi:RsiW-degrading membrane proteinase PrsW (M82 family)
MAFAHDEMLRFAALGLACAPVIPLALGLASLGRPSRELAATAFVAGGLAGLIGGVTYFVTAGLKLILSGWPEVVAEGFLAAGIPEELAKFTVLLGIVCAHEDCDIGLDIILGAAWIGLGFGALENVLYVVQDKDFYGIGVVRAILPLPFHVGVGIIMGCCVALAWKQGERRSFWTVTALALPMLLHGLIDVTLLSRGLPGDGPISTTVAGVFAADLAVTAVLIAIWAVRVIASVGPQRLHGGGHPFGALAPASRIPLIGRWLAIVAFGLVAATFAIGVPVSWADSGTLALTVGTISVFSLGFVVFFWRAPAKFRQHVRLLYRE